MVLTAALQQTQVPPTTMPVAPSTIFIIRPRIATVICRPIVTAIWKLICRIGTLIRPIRTSLVADCSVFLPHVWPSHWIIVRAVIICNTHTHNGPVSGTTLVSWYQKGKITLDITEARDSEWKWHQLGNMQVCTSLQTDNHASTPPLNFYIQAGCLSCHPTNRVKALNALLYLKNKINTHLESIICVNINATQNKLLLSPSLLQSILQTPLSGSH